MQRKTTIRVRISSLAVLRVTQKSRFRPKMQLNHRQKLLIIKEKDSLAGMQSSELSVELFCSKSDLAIVGVINPKLLKKRLTARNRPLGLSSIVELSQGAVSANRCCLRQHKRAMSISASPRNA